MVPSMEAITKSNELNNSRFIYCKSVDWANANHYHLQVQANSKKIAQKKSMLFLVSMRKTGLSHDIFFEFSVGPFEVVEVE